MAQCCSRVAVKILRRSLATFSSWARHTTASQSRMSSGPFTVMVSNLSLGSPAVRAWSSQAHLPTSAPFRARPFGRHPAGSSRRPPGAAAFSPRVPLPFGHRHPLLGHPVPPRDSAPLTIGLPDHPARTPTGFPRSTHARHGRGGCPLNPEASGVHTTGVGSPVAACRLLQRPGPTTRCSSRHSGLTITRHHQGFTCVHPSGLPLARLFPRTERGPLGFFLELRTPDRQDLRAHVEAGTDLEH